jgi:hypothetical protein
MICRSWRYGLRIVSAPRTRRASTRRLQRRSDPAAFAEPPSQLRPRRSSSAPTAHVEPFDGATVDERVEITKGRHGQYCPDSRLTRLTRRIGTQILPPRGANFELCSVRSATPLVSTLDKRRLTRADDPREEPR